MKDLPIIQTAILALKMVPLEDFQPEIGSRTPVPKLGEGGVAIKIGDSPRRVLIPSPSLFPSPQPFPQGAGWACKNSVYLLCPQLSASL